MAALGRMPPLGSREKSACSSRQAPESGQAASGQLQTFSTNERWVPLSNSYLPDESHSWACSMRFYLWSKSSAFSARVLVTSMLSRSDLCVASIFLICFACPFTLLPLAVETSMIYRGSERLERFCRLCFLKRVWRILDDSINPRDPPPPGRAGSF